MRETRPSQKAVTLLATTFVLLGGMVALTVIILASTDDPLPKVIGLAGGTGVFALLLWLPRDRQPGSGRWTWTWLRRKTTSVDAWRAAFRRPQPVAPPEPPTAEKLRELSQNTSTWVPSSRPRER